MTDFTDKMFGVALISALLSVAAFPILMVLHDSTRDKVEACRALSEPAIRDKCIHEVLGVAK